MQQVHPIARPASPPRPKLRTDAAAEYLGISSSTLEKYRRVSGGGPVYSKLGKAVVYDPNDLDDWLADNRRSSVSAAA